MNNLTDSACLLEVVRDEHGTCRLSWPPSLSVAPVRVFAAGHAGALNFAQPAAVATGACTLSGVGAPGYFVLQLADGRTVHAAPRHHAFEGSTNLRDAGGYATRDGRRVRWGRLYRSGHLSSLSPAAREAFAALGIRTVCDFRLASERAGEQAEIPGDPRMETLGVPPGKADQHFFHRLFETTDDPARVARELEAILRLYVRDFAAHYARMFEVLLTAEDEPVLLNCSAGKERTGVGVTLLLLALGVPRETARHEFLLSARYFPAQRELPRVLRKYAVPNRDEATLTRLVGPLLETPESYADAVFGALAEAMDEAGGETEFFARQLGLDTARRAALVAKFTQAV